nr:hypothetical protein CFP56_53723 [Quercus suber]
MTFLIRHQGGFTARLYQYARTRPGVQVSVLVDGPYGGIDGQKFFGSDRLVILAGGSGVGWMLPFIEEFLRFSSSRQAVDASTEEGHLGSPSRDEPKRALLARGPQSMRVVLATRDVATRAWFHTAVNDLQAKYESTGSDIMVEVHLTGKAEAIVQPPSKLAADSSSSSMEEGSMEKQTTQHHSVGAKDVQEGEVRGRADVPFILQEEAAAAAENGHRVGVFMCGPLTMQNDARNAVAKSTHTSLVKHCVPASAIAPSRVHEKAYVVVSTSKHASCVITHGACDQGQSGMNVDPPHVQLKRSLEH